MRLPQALPYRKQAQEKPSAPLGSVTPFGRMTCLAVKFDYM